MGEEIINRVANSSLITIDLTDYAPKYSIIPFDIKSLLFEGFILKEKEFRQQLKELDFSIYNDKTIALYCSSDAIIPMWAYMLITSYLNPISQLNHGTKEEVFQKIFLKNIEEINSSEFKGKKVIVKGCGNIPISAELYIAITKKLQNTVSSLMFGEACSAVPVFKKK
ncbi:MAG: DUF2480 family protein [Flavobacteriales bacterium]|nr:DUF2480 family protein [Flavobacteriales bacterium]